MHVEIASKINKIIDDKDLTDLGKLEQDLVFGDATSKEIITYISTNQKMSAEDKVCSWHSLLTHMQQPPASIDCMNAAEVTLQYVYKRMDRYSSVACIDAATLLTLAFCE